MTKPALIVCCSDFKDPQWRWLESRLTDCGIEFEFVRCVPGSFRTRFNTARVTGAIRTVLLARRKNARAIVAHGPTIAAWCGLVARVLRCKIPVLAHTFNFTTLPPQSKRGIFTFGLADMETCVVFSTMERELYSATFGIPKERFDVVLWGVAPPTVSTPGAPVEPGDYVCALGGNGRDYRSLIEAAKRLPHIRFVAVVRPDNLQGLDVPQNVVVHTNIPTDKAMNILFYSRFMVLPLVGTEVPCGHVTLVAAMHLGKAYVITDSSGVRDYAKDGVNSLTVKFGSSDDLAGAIARLWDDPQLCALLGENGKQFASAECSEERIAQHFREWLRARDIGSVQ